MSMLPSAQAGFTNGGFEADLTGWTVTSYNNNAAIPTFPPTKESDLGLSAPVADNGLTSVVGSGTDAGSGGALGYPLYGNKAVRINNGGNSNRVSSVDQKATMTIADVDPADGKVHVRFAIAPVLQNPGHPNDQQPYFFVEVTNVTKGNTQLFHTFNFSNQSGVPWVTVGAYQYTNWQAIDIAPGAGVLDVGDEIKVKIIGAGCSPGGHEGHVYVDSGPALTTLPGPYVYATGPQYTTAGSQITYTYTYGNSGTSPLTNTTVNVVSPQDSTVAPLNLTFASISGDGGVCTTPVAGTAGTILCNFGTYNPNNVGTFQVTYNVPGVAVGPINHGNYKISGDGSPAILGPLVQTNLSGATPLVDLGVTASDGQPSVTVGQVLSYTIVVSNAGPSAVPAGATINENVPGTLTVGAWTCVAAGGAACPNASGNGAISETTTAPIPMGGTLTYTVAATANAIGSGTIVNAVTVTAPAGVLDSNNANNTGADVNNVGADLKTLTVTKSGAGTGMVTTVPSGINCGATCASDYPTGSSVTLYASAPAGSIFAGWSGGGCSGTASSCTVTLGNATTVNADFTAPLMVTPVVGANGTVTPGAAQPVTPGGATSFTVTPSAGYSTTITDDCAAAGAQTGGTLVGTTYTTNAIAQNCSINFNFTNVGVSTVTPAVGANGSITPNTPLTVLTGGSVSYTVVPNSGYSAKIGGGTCPAGSWVGSVYTISPVGADCGVTFSFGKPPAANNDTFPSGVRNFFAIGNDVIGAAALDPATVDLDPSVPGIQTSRTKAQGTWTVDNTGMVTFAPVAGFYGTATLDYVVSDVLGFTSAPATMSVPIDPSGVVYNSSTRLPVAGATVTLLFNGGNANATVVGGNATQVTNGAGQYAFFLLPAAPAGLYSLTVSSAGYTFTSAVIPPQAGTWPPGGGPITPVVGAPSGVQPTTYYLSGPIPAADVTNNNIPLDPVPAAMSIPTLSEWGILLLAGLMVLFGFAAMRRQLI